MQWSEDGIEVGLGGMWMCIRHSGLSMLYFFQAEDGIRDQVRSRGLGDVYKRQGREHVTIGNPFANFLALVTQGVVVITLVANRKQVTIFGIKKEQQTIE